jgi:hypothetical protein
VDRRASFEFGEFAGSSGSGWSAAAVPLPGCGNWYHPVGPEHASTFFSSVSLIARREIWRDTERYRETQRHVRVMMRHQAVVLAPVLVVHQCIRTHSPHPPPWPGHSFPFLLKLTVC